MEGDSKPLLKYSADDYRGPPRGLRVGLAKVQKAGEVTTRGWARIVRIVRLREVFAEFLATFALLVTKINFQHKSLLLKYFTA